MNKKFTLLNNRKANLMGKSRFAIRVNQFLNPSLSVIIAAVFAVVIVGVLGFGGNARAQVIFEDNFDSHEDWMPAQGSECNNGICSGMPDGWHYYRSMGEFAPPENEETIRINSDNHRGSSGKAFTVWIESGSGGWNSDGILVSDLGTDYNEIFLQFYIKADPNWQWDSPEDGALKLLHVVHYDGSGNVFQYFSSGNNGPIYLAMLKRSQTYGYRHDHGVRCDPQETNYYCNPGRTGNSRFSGSPDPTITSSGQIADGDWHCWEFQLKMNTKTGEVWNNDGVLKFWQDGVLEYSLTDLDWIEAGASAVGWNLIELGGNNANHYSDPANKDEQWYVMDDVVVSTEYIGPDYVIDPGEDTTPPSRSNPQPTGTLTSGTTQTTISLDTNETATCKYDTASGVTFDQQQFTFNTTGSTTHFQTITNLSDGESKTYYVRCQDTTGNQNTDDFEISFSIASPSTTYSISNFINLVTDWLKSESGLESDVNGDGVVNTRDLGIMMSNWQ